MVLCELVRDLAKRRSARGDLNLQEVYLYFVLMICGRLNYSIDDLDRVVSILPCIRKHPKNSLSFFWALGGYFDRLTGHHPHLLT